MTRSALAVALGLGLLGVSSIANAQPEPVDPSEVRPAPPPPASAPAPQPQPPPPQVQARPAQPPYPSQYPYPYPSYPPPAPAPARRSPYGEILGLGLRLGAVFPLGDGYARGPVGMLADLSFWYEGKYFALEPRVGVRFDVVRGPNTYVEVPIDFGGYFLIGGGGASFFVGGGIGAHHIWETRGEDIMVGGVIPARMERRSDDRGWGFGAFGRIGVVFIRSFRQRLILSLEYNFTAVELNGFRNPTSLTCGLGFVL